MGSTRKTYRVIAALLLAIAFLASGCAGLKDETMFRVEQGITAGESGWNAAYDLKLDRCAAQYPPASPEAHDCFGPTFEADAYVSRVIVVAGKLIADYWRRRRDGESPDIAAMLAAISTAVAELPPEAKQYFSKIRGLQ